MLFSALFAKALGYRRCAPAAFSTAHPADTAHSGVHRSHTVSQQLVHVKNNGQGKKKKIINFFTWPTLLFSTCD